MRTTVTLDADVDALLQTVMKERGLSFKEAVNFAIRTGLQPKPEGRKRFVQKTFSLGLPSSFSWDKALQMSDELEDAEILRKLAILK